METESSLEERTKRRPNPSPSLEERTKEEPITPPSLDKRTKRRPTQSSSLEERTKEELTISFHWRNIQELKSNSTSDNCGKSQPKLSFAQLTHCVKETESTQVQGNTVNPLLKGHNQEGTVNQFQEDTVNPVVKRQSQSIVKGTQSRRHSQQNFRETQSIQLQGDTVNSLLRRHSQEALAYSFILLVRQLNPTKTRAEFSPAHPHGYKASQTV